MTTMTFTEAARTCLTHRYASFSGRGARSEYWWFSVVYVTVVAAVAVLSWALGSWEVNLLSLLVVVPMLSASVRRLHDTDRSGTRMLIALVPLAGPVIYLATMAIPSDPGLNRYGPHPTRPR